MGEWTKKMWYLYTVVFYSATKKNEISLFAGNWMELENIILSEISQVQKAKSCLFLSNVEYRQYKFTNFMKNTSCQRESHMKEGVLN
jgi:hypothetical protein